MSYSQNYVTGIALSQFVHGATILGLDVSTALKKVGLSDEHMQPTARVPEARYEMVLLQLMAQPHSPSFGADIGQQIIPPLYGVLMSLAFGSASLGEAITYLARYQGLATGNCGELTYVQEEQHYKLCISMTHSNPVVRRLVSECVMTFFSMLPKIITGRADLSPQQISFEHSPCSKSAQRYVETVLNCPVAWGTGESSITIGEREHAMPIFGHGEQMLKTAESLAQSQLEKINSQQSVIEKITWHIEEQMQSAAPRREEIARRLNMSVRTLDRRLDSADTSWQELLDHIRLKRATGLLVTSELSIVAIAEKLGFSDVRSFQRKFKTWTGMSPSDYRRGV
ncbi:AraC family transcriptional regulator [Litoribacillus peritrichatus]|uniref:AraC family transcriptional regulator n=1 Tax=Litoribacillus peritrichatus TaxID=718191 RepID=A0ABP7MX32_9GAMM